MRKFRWLLAGVAVLSAALAQERRPITETDLLDFVWIADPQMSPDGQRVAFVQVNVNAAKTGYETSVWLVSATGGPSRRLTNGSLDDSPRWAPDGRLLAFVRGSEKDGKREPGQIFVLPVEGGEAWALTKLPRGAQGPVWSPDGRRIAFLSRTNDEDMRLADCAIKKDPSCTTAPPSDVRVITRSAYRSDGPGYADFTRPLNIWAIDAKEGAEARRLTRGPYEENEPVWSADGARIYFTSNRTLDPAYEPRTANLYSVAAEGGDLKQVAAIGGTISDLSLSPDGRAIAFRGVSSRPSRSYDQPDLYVVPLNGDARPRNLTDAFDYDIGTGLTGDQRSPRGGSRTTQPAWIGDGRSLLMSVAKEGRVNLAKVDTRTGAVTAVSNGDHEVMDYSTSSSGGRIAMLIATPTAPGDLFTMNAVGGAPLRLTDVNKKLFSQVKLTPPEEIWYTSFDGRKIQAWIQKPPDFDPSKKYPLILNIHGGPHAAYGFTFDHEFQWMAAKGYVVLYPNPRGSTTYGQEFGNIIQHKYPGDDHKDLMAGVDELIKRGYIDSVKLGVTGGSGGGLLTNWAVTRTDRFAAAVAQRDIADWADWWYTADFTLFHPTWFRKAPFEDPAEYAARSPLTYVNRVKTPLMLILGEADLRTPPGAGGEQMFRALKYRKVPTVMVRFPGESHELSRSGQPRHRIERLRHIVNWFEIYLQGKKVEGYE